MDALTNVSSLRFSRVLLAYLLAVTTASVVFVLAQNLPEIPKIIAGTGFESATSFDRATKFQHLAFTAIPFFIIGWIFSFVTALIPFAIGISIARQLGIRHWLYYLLGGALTAIALESVFLGIPNLGINVQDHEPSLGEKYLSALPYFLASGTAAGASCFAFLRRGFNAGA
jgi:hypothetical protein